MRLIVAIRASAFVAVTLVAAQAHAQSSCPAVDAFWFNAIASGNTVSYGFGVDGTIQPLKGLKDGTALSAVGVIKFFGTSTELRYTGHEFVQNWKTPKGAGACHVVRITTTTDGGSLSATFKMK
jgi:hypothetical protein